MNTELAAPMESMTLFAILVRLAVPLNIKVVGVVDLDGTLFAQTVVCRVNISLVDALEQLPVYAPLARQAIA
jgi:hypothetical protein